jgi:hypothetical protein
MADEGLLGGLPRERPGRRSAKRGTASDSAAEAEPEPARTRPEPVGDPLSGAVRVAGRVAEAGVRTAGRLADGLLRRGR